MSINGEIWEAIRRLEETVDALNVKVYHLENPKDQKAAPAKKAAAKLDPKNEEPNKAAVDVDF